MSSQAWLMYHGDSVTCVRIIVIITIQYNHITFLALAGSQSTCTKVSATPIRVNPTWMRASITSHLRLEVVALMSAAQPTR